MLGTVLAGHYTGEKENFLTRKPWPLKASVCVEGYAGKQRRTDPEKGEGRGVFGGRGGVLAHRGHLCDTSRDS